jgi:spore germination protein YaaH
MKIYLSLILLLSGIIHAQNNSSIMKEQSQYYKQFGLKHEYQWDSLSQTPMIMAAKTNSTSCDLTKKVYGWHPYWSGSTIHNNYDWSMISEFCYFDYEVSPTTGNNTNASFAWSTSAAVNAAFSNSVNVHFCATMFSNHATFWASSTAQQTFITNAINLLTSRGAHGLNIDFEVMGSADKIPFKNFMINLSTQLKATNPNYKLTMALYAVEWSSVFDIPALVPYVDDFIIMGYDYYYAGSTIAGPTAPLYNFDPTYDRTLSRSITYYLNQGVPASKLLLGLPYYGREWGTVSNTIPSSVITPTSAPGAFTSSRTYSFIRNNPTTYSVTNRYWDANSYTPYYTYQSSGNWRQCFIDDKYSMSKKFDMVNQRGLGGIGIWALGYDNGYSDYWDAIKEKFSSCKVVNCTDSIFDMGGPNRNYYSSESYSFTISPDNANKVKLTFSQFNLEQGFDSLYIYDGPSISSPTLAVRTGTAIPGIIQSTGPFLTLRFKSDGATNRAGFKALWECQLDNTPPTTQISSVSGWITNDFIVNYTDADNVNGSGLEDSFYQVSYFDGIEWRANAERGFFNDDFNTNSLHPDWTNAVGTWTINSGNLHQTDETNSNANVYSALTQTLSNRYLYHFKGTISGAAASRRAGIHIFCDDASQSNRGNNYLIWMRPDQGTIELYKNTSNVLSVVKTVTYTVNANVTYDYKISFDRISGELKLWINNNFITSWIDATPFMNGNAISFRTGNCQFRVDDLRVYRSRANSTSISVGNSNTKDIRKENSSPSIASAKINSIVKDNFDNISAVSTQTYHIDWTPPIMLGSVNDGSGSDRDTTFVGNQLLINYSAAKDTNSGVLEYYYAIGTFAGAQDVVAWTNNALNLTVTQNGMSLSNGLRYYTMVKSKNNAGLVSDSIVSDGILYLLTTLSADLNLLNELSIFPNPAKNDISITLISDKEYSSIYQLIDAAGKIINEKELKIKPGVNSLNINVNAFNLSQGVYFFKIVSEHGQHVKKLIIE